MVLDIANLGCRGDLKKMSDRRLSALFGLWLAFCFSSQVRAADLWTVNNVRGSVLALIDGSWREVDEGDLIAPDTALRTLQAGGVELRRGADVFSLGPDTAIRPSTPSGDTELDQYAGILTVTTRSGAHYRVTTPAFIVTQSRADLIIRVNGKQAILIIKAGTVSVALAGQNRLLAPGQTLQATAGQVPTITSSSTAAQPPGGADGSGSNANAGDDQDASTAAKSDNGKGNGEAPGNGGANGNKGNGNNGK